jgi:hypothetical protein
MLQAYPSVTVLSFESGPPRGEALLGGEERQELIPWAQQHIVREWLLSLLWAGPMRR